jgi:ssDNA-binding Zn-finger/Zn-ribbon topoisomerase 1
MPEPPVCKKCGSPLEIKSKGTFNYVGCPNCASAKQAAKGVKKPAAAAKKSAGGGPQVVPAKKETASTPHWLDDYV